MRGRARGDIIERKMEKRDREERARGEQRRKERERQGGSTRQGVGKFTPKPEELLHVPQHRDRLSTVYPIDVMGINMCIM